MRWIITILALTAGLTGCNSLPGGPDGRSLQQDIPFAGRWNCAGQQVEIGDMTFAMGGAAPVDVVSIAVYGGAAWEMALLDGRVMTVTSLSADHMTLTDGRRNNALPCSRS